jgi:hypothetical protein
MLKVIIRNLRSLTNLKPNGIEIENIRFGLIQDLDTPTYLRRPDLVEKLHVEPDFKNKRF